MRLGVVGATGLVGRKMLEVLEERNVKFDTLRLFASARAACSKIPFKGNSIAVDELTEPSFDDLDYALFSAGGETSKKFAPVAAKKNCIVIDNSSAWRQDPDCPLVVPEVNSDHLEHHNNIIANPNCSTIQLVVALKPIADVFGLNRVICSTYQSISGAGQSGIDKLNSELKKSKKDSHDIAFNTLFHPIEENGFTNEENKMYFETRRILTNPDLKLAFTCVRLPILGGHAESVNIETIEPCDELQIKQVLNDAPGITYIDEETAIQYPTPIYADNKDDVFVGRIRKDESADHGFHIWIVSDNLRKGAATNAVQILEELLK
jgi:aspartate-semialdehyde dehydrogenase